jgi:protease I
MPTRKDDAMPEMRAMTGQLDGLRVAVLTANEGVEEVELTEPVKALEGAGAEVHLVAPKEGKVQAFRHLDKALAFPVDEPIDQVSVDDFDALVLPGGVANPDQLRTVPEAVAFAGGFVDQGKPVASICHGPWTLVEAGVLHNRTLTSWPSLRTDIRNAGGRWIDDDVVVDANGPGPIVTSRKPDDLPRFCDEMVSTFARA